MSHQTSTASLTRARAGAIALFGALLILSLALRVRGIGSAFWIDEGLSVGIGSHSLGEIPGILKLDGSPPLYYMLLHVWMSWFGDSEAATQALSLVFALLAIPAAFWAARAVFGRRAAWAAAALTAVNPFLTYHSYEARMYALMALLSVLATGAFLQAFVLRRRIFVPVFGLVLATMLYTHNWTFFFGAAAVIALVLVIRDSADRRGLIRDGAIAFGLAALLYLPWVPTLLYQVQHTGAPWSQTPAPGQLLRAMGSVLGGSGAAMATLLAAGAGFAAVLALKRSRERRAVLAVISLAIGTLLLAWLVSQVTPAWAWRYFAVLVGPVLIGAAAGFARAGRLGVAGLAIMVLTGGIPGDIQIESRASERAVMRELEPELRAGDLVLTTHPERVPVLRYYTRPGLRWVTLMGPVRADGFFDWTDALERARRRRVANALMPWLDRLPVGRRLMFVRPIWNDGSSWDAPWTSLIRDKSRHWSRTLANDPRLRYVASAPRPYSRLTSGVRAVVYEKVRR